MEFISIFLEFLGFISLFKISKKGIIFMHDTQS